MPAYYAVDFETSYSTGRDIKSLGVVPYVEHKDTQLYLVSIVGPGISYSGPLEAAPWPQIHGHHWVSHNAAFDAAVFVAAKKRGQIPAAIFPVEWDCTANMAVYFGAPRSLSGACQALLGIVLDKGTRDAMKGKTWESMSESFRQEVIDYALNDSGACLALWDSFHAHWPEKEKEISRHTMAMCLNGIGVDLVYVDKCLAKLAELLWECQQSIPWIGELDSKGKEIAPTSSKALKLECIKVGIPPPLTTADKSEIFDLWCTKYEDKAPFVRAVKEYRSLNRTIEVFKKIREQTRPDNRLRYSLKYYGAHTGRFSGDSGLNMQNFPRVPIYIGVDGKRLHPRDKKLAAWKIDLRGSFVPAPGKKFVVADLKQIEARVALWFAGDWEQLKLIGDGLDVYEAHARRTMGYNLPRELKEYCDDPSTPPEQRKLRDIAKARVLGLGFGLGAARLVTYAKVTLNLDLTLMEAKKIIDDFRAKNPGIVRMWQTLDRAMRRHALKKDGTPFFIELPNGNHLAYFNVSLGADGLVAQDEMGGPLKHWYGGKLFENLVQATARCVLGDANLRLDANNFPVVLHVHDEPITEVDLNVSAKDVAAVVEQPVPWAPGLPIGSDAKELMRYQKA